MYKPARLFKLIATSEFSVLPSSHILYTARLLTRVVWSTKSFPHTDGVKEEIFRFFVSAGVLSQASQGVERLGNIGVCVAKELLTNAQRSVRVISE